MIIILLIIKRLYSEIAANLSIRMSPSYRSHLIISHQSFDKFNMNKTFRQVFQEERELESSLAKYWGYNIKNSSLDSRLKRENEGKVPIVANINTLKLTKDIPKTERIAQIQEELRAIENGRLLARFTEDANKRQSSLSKVQQQKSPVIKMMEDKIKQYNYIVHHKHLNKDFHEQTRKILKIDKDETEILLDKIQMGQDKLKNANLNTQIQVNKYMAQLYKSYRTKLDKNRTMSSNKAYKTKTMISQPAKSANNAIKHEQIPKLQQIRHFNKQNSDRKGIKTKSDKSLLINLYTVQDNIHHTEAQTISNYNSNFPSFQNKPAKFGNITDRSANRGTFSNQRKQRIERTLYSPFMEKEKLENYNSIEKKNKSNHQALDLFKTKINDFRTKNIHLSKEKLHSKPNRTTIQQSLKGISTIKEQLNSSLHIDHEEQETYNSILSENRQKYDNQRLIFAELLKKKHNKFNRIGVSKVLVKYNEQRQAKDLLKGEQMISAIEDNNQNKTGLIGSKATRLSKYSTLKGESNMDYTFDDENDNEHYERMCKNEKINLLLKHK